jgi:hypothetical protein
MHDLSKFNQMLPPGVDKTTSGGDLVFGSKIEDSIPYRMPPGVPQALDRNIANSLPVSAAVAVRTFDLSNPEHLVEYTKIKDAIFAKWCRLIHEEHHWWEKSETPKMYVFIEYAVLEKQVKPYHVLNSLGKTISNDSL